MPLSSGKLAKKIAVIKLEGSVKRFQLSIFAFLLFLAEHVQKTWPTFVQNLTYLLMHRFFFAKFMTLQRDFLEEIETNLAFMV